MATTLIGKVSPTMGGTYSASATYYALTFVENGGTTYLSLQTVSGVEPGVTSGWQTYWMLIAQKGDTGDVGKGLTILGNYTTLADLQAAVTSPSPGDAYGVGSSAPYGIYIWSSSTSTWVDYGQLQGVTGQSATINVGTTTTGNAGTNASVTNSGTSSAAVFNFTIPRGANGSQWYTGTGITGTSTTPTIFTASGVTLAVTNDMYLNVTTANIYQCVVGGISSVATWSFLTTINGIVKTVNGVSPNVNGNVIITIPTILETSGTFTSAGWVGASAPYTQEVTSTGVLPTDNPIIDVVLSTTSATAISEMDAWAYIGKIETSSNQLTATCYKSKPTLDLNFNMQISR